MWQGAHGRLAAITLLAGGRSGRATTPKPVHDDAATITPGLHTTATNLP